MKLSIVIPALNEEAAIGAIIRRTLDAVESIVRDTQITDVQIVVVSDGSSDRTPDIALEFVPQIKVISYRNNRGYGAAIKLGFEHSDGDLVGFLDADGTCDPLFFATLVNEMVKNDADLALGNRMTTESRMPTIRKVGNALFALTINLIASTQISDSASGMRVIKRSSLPKLYPLPNGLHFTPAMSCKAALDEGLRMVETPMPYAERTGKSKLSVLRDGMRFARVIFDIALTYRPFRIFGSLGLFLMIVMGIFGLELVNAYFKTGRVSDGMIFRVMAIIVLGVSGLIAFALGMLGERVAHLSHTINRPHGSFYKFFRKITQGQTMFWAGVLSMLIAIFFALKPTFQFFVSGRILTHWSQVGLAGFCFLFGVQLLAMSALDRMLATLTARKSREGAFEDDPEQIVGE